MIPIVLRRLVIALPQQFAVISAYLPPAVHLDADPVFALPYLVRTKQQVVSGKVIARYAITGTDITSALKSRECVKLADARPVRLPYFMAKVALAGHDQTAVCCNGTV